MAEIYQSSKSNISEHIKHIFEDGELAMDATVWNFRIVQVEGSRSVEREIGINGKGRLVNLVLSSLWYGDEAIFLDPQKKHLAILAKESSHFFARIAVWGSK